MRNKSIIYIIFVAILSLSGCFKDNGNYEYKMVEAPTWLFDVYSKNINVEGRLGNDVEFKASDKFVWKNEDRSDKVRYEWWLNDVLISEELDFKIRTEDLMRKANMEQLPDAGRGIMGSLKVIDKETDITYMARVFVDLTPRFTKSDFVIISEDGENTKVSAAILEKGENGKYFYRLEENIFESANDMKIEGKPIGLHLSEARNIGPQGSMSIMTEKLSYEIDAATMFLVRELKDEFPDGTPDDFVVADRDDIDLDDSRGSYTFLATKDGKVYTRNLTANYLGGKFLSEPYVMDSKGYKITKFGEHRFGYPNIPCYDEKNNRMVMANVWSETIYDVEGYPMGKDVYKSRLSPITPASSETQAGVPVWNMPEGTKMLFVSQTSHLENGWIIPSLSTGYTMIYNTAENKTMIADFVVSNSNLTAAVHAANKFWFEFPNDYLDENTIFLTSAGRASWIVKETKSRILYTKGNELRFIERPAVSSSDFFYPYAPITTGTMFTFDSEITCVMYDWYNYNETIAIGCANGDLYFYDIYQIRNPILLSKLNVGGKVVSAKEFGVIEGGSNDHYH